MTQRTISRSEYFQLIGLLTLAKKHNETLKDIERAALAITKEVDDLGHTADAVYGNRSPDELLALLDITVRDSDS